MFRCGVIMHYIEITTMANDEGSCSKLKMERKLEEQRWDTTKENNVIKINNGYGKMSVI